MSEWGQGFGQGRAAGEGIGNALFRGMELRERMKERHDAVEAAAAEKHHQLEKEEYEKTVKNAELGIASRRESREERAEKSLEDYRTKMGDAAKYKYASMSDSLIRSQYSALQHKAATANLEPYEEEEVRQLGMLMDSRNIPKEGQAKVKAAMAIKPKEASDSGFSIFGHRFGGGAGSEPAASGTKPAPFGTKPGRNTDDVLGLGL